MLTMTETWMSGRGGTRQPQQQPDPHHDLYSDTTTGAGGGDPHHVHMRSSLGQLIERSISAPPSSNAHGDPSHSYAMQNSVLWSNPSPMPTSSSSGGTVSGYTSQSATPVVHNGRAGMEGLDEQPQTPFGGALLIQETMDNSGRATAPSTYWDAATNNREVLDASGRRSADPPSRSSLGTFQEEDNHYLAGGSLLAASLGLGLQRSHSAAPSFGSNRDNARAPSPTNHHSLGPPPGLSRLSDRVARPASAGLLDATTSSYGPSTRSVSGGGAVRPAAKTLMDLIQEDMPVEENEMNSMPPQQQSQQQLPQRRTPQPPHQYFNGGMAPPQQHQQQFLPQQQQMSFQQQGMRPVYEQPTSPSPSYTMVSQQQQQQQPPQQAFNGNLDNLNYGMQNMSIKNPANNQMFVDRTQVQQRFIPSGFDGADDGYGAPQLQQQQHRQAPQTMPMRQQQHQPERMYFSPQQAQAPQQQAQQPVEVQAPRLQAQILPNGQTVYVQAAPQPAQGMGYTTAMNFPPAGAQAAGTTQLYQRSDGQYVSVVPVHQTPNAPMTFWQADGSTGQAVLVSGSTGGGTLTAAVPHGLMPAGRDPMPPALGVGVGGGRHPKGGSGGGGAGGRNRRNDRSAGRRSDGKGGGASVSSPVLEEFRTNKNRQWTIGHIEGHVVEFCQDQNGSRFIQQRLEMGDLMEQAIVIREVLPAIRRLRNDVFGNYVVQKLLDFGTPEVRADIRDTLEGEMMQLSLQMYGCRVVQKALETIVEEDLSRLLKEFHHNVLSCIYDQNGNHVIQKCIEVMSTRSKKALAQGDQEHSEYLRGNIQFIVNDVLINAASLSCHPYGCRVLQRILEHCDEETKHKILDEVKTSHKRLLDDQYGNYVIQHVLQFGRTSDRDSILHIVQQSGLLGLSRQKFASNVVEKLLKYGNSNHRRAIAAEMLQRSTDISIANQPPEGTSVVLLMVRDAYANYVVQTTLDVVPESEEKRLLLLELKSHSDELKNYTFAKHIVKKILE